MVANMATEPDGLHVRTTLSCEETARRTRRALSAESFRYPTEIDVHASLQTRPHLFIRYYRIPRADSPPLPAGGPSDWGMALPCDLDLFVDPHSGEPVVLANDPRTLIMEYGQRGTAERACQVIRARLEAAPA